MLAVAVHVPAGMLAGTWGRVGDGVAGGVEGAGGGEVAIVGGLGAGAQATTRMARTIVNVTRDSGECIRSSPDGVRLRRSAMPIVTPTRALK